MCLSIWYKSSTIFGNVNTLIVSIIFDKIRGRISLILIIATILIIFTLFLFSIIKLPFTSFTTVRKKRSSVSVMKPYVLYCFDTQTVLTFYLWQKKWPVHIYKMVLHFSFLSTNPQYVLSNVNKSFGEWGSWR